MQIKWDGNHLHYNFFFSLQFRVLLSVSQMPKITDGECRSVMSACVDNALLLLCIMADLCFTEHEN